MEFSENSSNGWGIIMGNGFVTGNGFGWVLKNSNYFACSLGCLSMYLPTLQNTKNGRENLNFPKLSQIIEKLFLTPKKYCTRNFAIIDSRFVTFYLKRKFKN